MDTAKKFEILRGSTKLTLDEWLHIVLLDMNEEKMAERKVTLDTLQQLLKSWPEMDTIKKLEDVRGEYAELAEAEQFILKVWKETMLFADAHCGNFS